MTDVLEQLRGIAAAQESRAERARRAAEVIREAGRFRWVGLYDVHAGRGDASNIGWAGPNAPAHPSFALTGGLTGEAVRTRRSINVGDVTKDPRYLTTLATTRSEIVVPVVEAARDRVVGTIDVESEAIEAFDSATQTFVEQCAEALQLLWSTATVSPRWEWPPEEIRRVGYRVVDLIADHLSGIRERPVFRPFPPPLAATYLESEPPEHGTSADALLDRVESEIAQYPFGNGHPRFYGWVNSPPVVLGVFAEALAAAMNPSCAGGNHAAIYVERQVVDWFRQMLGLPPGTMGLLVSGGSMAALTALATARHARCQFDVRAQGLQGTPRRLIFYRSGEAHGCHQKAVELLGIGSDNIRTIAHDAALRMIPSALDAAIRADIAEGQQPIAVIASAGTVNTGTIDPLDELADVCARTGLWLHVDAAYGGPAILSTRYRTDLAGLSRADSVALDPHKWLYVPVEAGLVLVRNGEAMRAAFSLVPPYLRTDGNVEGIGGLPWFSEYGFQQTRAFRALKVWLALQYHGLDGYRASIDRDIALADTLSHALRAAPDFEILEPQSLSIVCFRYAPPDGPRNADAVDTFNKALLERVQLSGRAFVSSTTIDGRFWLRACVVNPRACEEDVLAILDVIRDSARAQKA